MNDIELLEYLTDKAIRYRSDAKKSIVRNNHMNDIQSIDEQMLNERVIDSILVDFINYIGIQQGIDYALYTRDIKK